MPSWEVGRTRWAVLIYVATTFSYFLLAAPETLTHHTPHNHFALLAEGWLEGRLALSGTPPSYTGNNDFALFNGEWFVVFPAFPALLLVPWVWLAGGAEHTLDGQFTLWLAGLGPAFLFLVLEKLSGLGFSLRSRLENVALALLFAWGSVYCFTAVQGTVWFSAHVVAVSLTALYCLFALKAERPLLAGVSLGLAFLTRTPLLLAFPLFALEAYRVAKLAEGRLDWRTLLTKLGWFGAPVAACVCVALSHNFSRFGQPFNFGYEYLEIVWRARIERWGLFGYHYLPRNLGVMLTSLPYWNGWQSATPVQINGHGLALWVTTPFYLWLCVDRRKTPLHLPLRVSALAVAIPSLFYQNTGWLQFGYRFSNDYAVFLFGLLALSGLRVRRAFWVLALFAVSLNVFGAKSFGRADSTRYYDIDPSQRRIYQSD